MVDLQTFGALALHVGPVHPSDVHPPSLRVGGDLLVVGGPVVVQDRVLPHPPPHVDMVEGPGVYCPPCLPVVLGGGAGLLTDPADQLVSAAVGPA